jgi:hypothetical protein
VSQHTFDSKASIKRGLNNQWRQSIHQRSTDGQASVRDEDTPYSKASVEESDHDTLSSKTSVKEEASNNDGYSSAKGESDSGKASLVMKPTTKTHRHS